MVITDCQREKFMRLALKEAELALAKDEVPIGAVVVKNNRVIASAHNTKETARLASAHAEMLAIDRASLKLGGWRLTDCDLYVTIEPCAMCAGLIYQARINTVVYGAKDLKGGACGTAMNVLNNDYINHRVDIVGGILEDQCTALIQAFFKAKRTK